MNEETLSRVQAVMSQTKVTDHATLAASVAKVIDSTEGASGLIEALVAIYLLKSTHGWSSDETAVQISQAYGLPSDPDIRRQIKANLPPLLDSVGFITAAKTTDIMFANERTHNAARIITEVRPVFDEDLEAPPLAAVVVHQLELSYFENGETKTFYTVLDDGDLEQLKSVVERAQQKSSSIQTFFDKAGIKALGRDI
jgi:hypothetical protein